MHMNVLSCFTFQTWSCKVIFPLILDFYSGAPLSCMYLLNCKMKHQDLPGGVLSTLYSKCFQNYRTPAVFCNEFVKNPLILLFEKKCVRFLRFWIVSYNRKNVDGVFCKQTDPFPVFILNYSLCGVGFISSCQRSNADRQSLDNKAFYVRGIEQH